MVCQAYREKIEPLLKLWCVVTSSSVVKQGVPFHLSRERHAPAGICYNFSRSSRISKVKSVMRKIWSLTRLTFHSSAIFLIALHFYIFQARHSTTVRNESIVPRKIMNRDQCMCYVNVYNFIRITYLLHRVADPGSAVVALFLFWGGWFRNS